MSSFNTQIEINAKAEVVWKILTDISSWPEWNKTIDDIQGSIMPGGKVTVHTKANPGKSFPLKVSKIIPNQAMVWTGGMPFGLFTGKRIFTITAAGDNSVEFAMTEQFTGLMAPLITRSIPDLQPSFDEFAQCLKEIAESTDT